MAIGFILESKTRLTCDLLPLFRLLALHRWRWLWRRSYCSLAIIPSHQLISPAYLWYLFVEIMSFSPHILVFVLYFDAGRHNVDVAGDICNQCCQSVKFSRKVWNNCLRFSIGLSIVSVELYYYYHFCIVSFQRGLV